MECKVNEKLLEEVILPIVDTGEARDVPTNISTFHDCNEHPCIQGGCQLRYPAVFNS